MTFALIPETPATPTYSWLREFADNLVAAQPGLSSTEGLRCALLAHKRTWLLDPAEAAELWRETNKSGVAIRRLPRGLLG